MSNVIPTFFRIQIKEIIATAQGAIWNPSGQMYLTLSFNPTLIPNIPKALTRLLSEI
jgi:hypothetical protein